MRVGTRVGPFYTSTSTAGCAPWIVSFIILFVIIALVVDHPVAAIVTGVVLASLIGSAVRRSRQRRRQAIHEGQEVAEEQRAEEKARVVEDAEMWRKVEDLFERYNQGHVPEALAAYEYRKITGRDFYGDTER